MNATLGEAAAFRRHGLANVADPTQPETFAAEVARACEEAGALELESILIKATITGFDTVAEYNKYADFMNELIALNDGRMDVAAFNAHTHAYNDRSGTWALFDGRGG